MTRAVCPGSFDPVTRGYLDVVGRAAVQFDELFVAIGRNASKRGLFDAGERLAMMRTACTRWPNVEVELFDGLLVDFCRERGASCIVKGVRTASDVDYELPMARMNQRLTGVDTMFLPAAPEWSYLSSSLVREVAGLGGDVTDFVPDGVAEQVLARIEAGHD